MEKTRFDQACKDFRRLYAKLNFYPTDKQLEKIVLLSFKLRYEMEGNRPGRIEVERMIAERNEMEVN